MGLDTTHDAWHGPYSSFNQFRKWLAAKIGIELYDYIGYGDNATKDLKSIEHDIQPLLDHSDCDGELTPEECKRISAGLKQIIDAIPDEERKGWLYESALRFRKGCIKAHNAKQIIEFH